MGRQCFGLHCLTPWLTTGILIFAAIPAHAQPQSAFGGERTYPLTGDAPEAAIWDVNHDGLPDILVAEPGALSAVSIWIGDGRGALALHSRTPIASPMFAAAFADLNDDALPDIAFTVRNYDEPSAVGIALGTPDGGYGAPAFYEADTHATDLEIDDLNRDGILDVLVANHKMLTCHLGNGDGTLGERIDAKLPIDETAPYPIYFLRTLRIADLDRDGMLDAMVAPGGRAGLEIFRGRGDGSFQSLPFEVPASMEMAALTPCDLDLDGWTDLVLASDALVVLWNDRDGSLDFAVRDTIGPRGGDLWYRSMLVADFDADGNTDILHPTLQGRTATWVSHVRGLGNRSFEPAPTLWLSRGDYSDPIRLLATADLDKDGLLDLISYRGDSWETNRHELSLLLHATKRQFQCFSAIPVTESEGACGVFPVQLFYPDRLEFLQQGDGFVRAWSIDHDGIPSNPRTISFAGLLQESVDLDADGIPELIASAGQGMQILTTRDEALFSFGVWDDARFVAIGDFDGNHLKDVLVRNPDRSMRILLNDGHGFNAIPTRGLPNAQSRWDVCAGGDLNADGFGDIVFHGRGSWLGSTDHVDSVHVLFGDGSGGFHGPKSYSFEFAGGRGSEILVDDLDDDGDQDVAFLAGGDGSSGICGTFLNSGDGHLTPGAMLWTHENPHNLVATDLNFDGRKDIAYGGMYSGYEGRLRVHYLGEDGSYTEEQRKIGFMGGYPFVVDVDRDLRPDVLADFRDYPNTSFFVILWNTTPSIRTPLDATSPRHASPTLAIRRVTPNPTRSTCTMDFLSASTAPVRIELFDVAGRRLHARTVSGMTPGEKSVRVEVPSELPAGLYLLRVGQESRSATARVAVVR